MSGTVWVQFGEGAQDETLSARDVRVIDAGHLIVTKPDGSVYGYANGAWGYFEFIRDDS